MKSNDKNVAMIAQGFDGRDIIRTPRSCFLPGQNDSMIKLMRHTVYDGGKSSFERVSRKTNTVSLIYDSGRHERLVLTNDQSKIFPVH